MGKVIIKRYINHSYRAVIFGLLLTVLILPISSTHAISQGNDLNLIVMKTLDHEIVGPKTKVLSVEKTESLYEKTKKANRRSIVAKNTQKVVPTVDKSDLVKQAAQTYGIDWKILMAVWQVESGMQLKSPVRSSVGAQGPLQFMPGTWRAYGKDGNGDGIKDVTDARDALFAAADLLARNGLSKGETYRALYAYNHASWYVWKVIALASTFN